MRDREALAGARYALDTSVVSELMRAAPDARVQAWCDAQGSARLAIAAPTVMELCYGAELLSDSERKHSLLERIEAFVSALFGPRILGFGANEARACAALMAKKRALGESLDDHLADAMIAACGRIAGLAVATRNEREFRNTGVKVVNPWRKGR